jgi:hypothetical protein
MQDNKLSQGRADKTPDMKLADFRTNTNNKLSVLENQLSEMAASIRTLKAVVSA